MNMITNELLFHLLNVLHQAIILAFHVPLLQMVLVGFDLGEVFVPIGNVKVVFVCLLGFALHHVVYGLMLGLLI